MSAGTQYKGASPVSPVNLIAMKKESIYNRIMVLSDYSSLLDIHSEIHQTVLTKCLPRRVVNLKNDGLTYIYCFTRKKNFKEAHRVNR